MKIAGYESHPAADLLPLLRRPELLALAEDIRANGLQHPIVLLDGMVLDGRNRLRACEIARVRPRFVEWKGRGSPTGYVLSANLRRRHLTKSQEAIVAAKALPLFEVEAKERQRQAARLTHQKLGRGNGMMLGANVRSASGKASEHASEALGVSPRYVETAKTIIRHSPKLAHDVERGYMTLSGAMRVITRERQLATVAAYKMPGGTYPTIVADPPWRYFEDENKPREGAPVYATMSVEEICALKLPAAEDCVLWLWTTNSMMHAAYHVLDAWGFEPKTILTWNKVIPRLGCWLRGQTEHCILATRGSPVIALRRPSTLITEQSGRHSSKPEAFYTLVEQLCPAEPRLELFARRKRPGWVCSGAELLEAPAVQSATAG